MTSNAKFDELAKTWSAKETVYHRAIKDLAVAKTEALINVEELRGEVESLEKKIKLAKNRIDSILEFNNCYRETDCFVNRILDQLEKVVEDI